MRILFRVDGHPESGMGHIVRSVAIADKLMEFQPGLEIVFYGFFDPVAARMLTLGGYRFMNTEGVVEYEELQLNEKVSLLLPDCLFVDKLYDYGKEYIAELRKKCRVIMFHNICEGALFSDVFILPSAHTDDTVLNRIAAFSGPCRVYAGAEYIPINEGVIGLRDEVPVAEKEPDIVRILVTTGGSDPEGVSLKLMNWLMRADYRNTEIVFLRGASYCHDDELQRLMLQLPDHLSVKEFDYTYFRQADIAISTFGVTTYELLYMGIPVVSIGHCRKNAAGSRILAERYNAVFDCGLIDEIAGDQFILDLKRFINNRSYRIKLSENGRKLIDGFGLNRIAKITAETCQ